MEPSRAPRAGGALLAVLVIALLVAVVALASRPEGAGAGGAAVNGASTRLLLDVATYLFVVFVVLGMLVIGWALWPRPGEEMPPLPPRRRWALSTAIATVMVVAISVWLRGRARLGRPPNVLGGLGAGRTPGGLPGQGGSGAPPGFDWVAAAIVATVLVAVVVTAWWFLRPRRRTGASPLARLQAVLDDAIEDVMAEADPRRAVIAAWTRLERVLARQGLSRRDSEAPFEYAGRAGAALAEELGVDGAWLQRLAELFEWARFSTHDVTPDMRDEALRGLIAVRDGLRAAPAEPVPASP